MKITLIATFALTIAPGLFAQSFDFSTLDKLGANANSSTNVTLDADMLKSAAGLLGRDDDKKGASLWSLAANLKAVYVRSYDFDKPGQYNEADLAPLRAYLRQPRWKNIVDVRDAGESTQVFLLPGAGDKLAGMAVVSTEPAALTVVYIEGDLNMSDLEKLGGKTGIPDLKRLGTASTAAPKPDNKNKTGK